MTIRGVVSDKQEVSMYRDELAEQYRRLASEAMVQAARELRQRQTISEALL